MAELNRCCGKGKWHAGSPVLREASVSICTLGSISWSKVVVKGKWIRRKCLWTGIAPPSPKILSLTLSDLLAKKSIYWPYLKMRVMPVFPCEVLCLHWAISLVKAVWYWPTSQQVHKTSALLKSKSQVQWMVNFTFPCVFKHRTESPSGWFEREWQLWNMSRSCTWWELEVWKGVFFPSNSSIISACLADGWPSQSF